MRSVSVSLSSWPKDQKQESSARKSVTGSLRSSTVALLPFSVYLSTVQMETMLLCHILLDLVSYLNIYLSSHLRVESLRCFG